MSAPGWYADPAGSGSQRYFDGNDWTQHFAAPTPAAPSIAVAVANSGGGGSGGMHAVCALMTFLTCGLFLPVWIICAIVDGSSNRPASAVAISGAQVYPQPQMTAEQYQRQCPQQPQGQPQPRPRHGRSVAKVLGLVAAGIVGVFFGLAVLGYVVAHPLALLVVAPLTIGLGVIVWDHKAKERKLRERELADAMAERADREHQLAQEGDPRGTHGRYPPAV